MMKILTHFWNAPVGLSMMKVSVAICSFNVPDAQLFNIMDVSDTFLDTDTSALIV